MGTTKYGTDVSDYTLYSADQNVFLDLTLDLFASTGKYYYVTARAKNGVDLLSKAIVSSKIKVLRANVAGVVTVGQSGIGLSGEYQAERDTVTLRFDGFSSELCSIQYYQWSIGTTFGDEQIQEVSAAGVVVNAGGSGVAQSLLTLYLNESVYTEVKAVTACTAGSGESIIISYGHGEYLTLGVLLFTILLEKNPSQ